MILAIDLGTTYFKFTLFERSREIVRVVRVDPGTRHPLPGRHELDVNRFLAALDEGIGRALTRDGRSKYPLDAISFATQTNSFLLLDKADHPLTPLILWPDDRARSLEQDWLREPLAGLADVTGVPALGCEFMVAKLQWLKQHQPELWQKAARICLISDYLTLLLAGQHVTEAGAAGLTGLVDIHSRQWWTAAVDRFEIPPNWLPEMAGAGTDLGSLALGACQRWGLPRTCRLIVGCLDQYAGAVGVGNMNDNVLSETTGTVLSAICCTPQVTVSGASGSVFHGPAFRNGLFYRMVFGSISANLLHAYRDQLPERPSFDELSRLAEQIAPGCEGLRIDRHAATPALALQALPAGASQGHVTRAIMEAVALALHDVEQLRGESESYSEIRSAGGGSRSTCWLQIKADVLGLPVRATRCPEPTSLGAAILAEAALSGTPPETVADQWVKLQPALVPDTARHHAYQALKSA